MSFKHVFISFAIAILPVTVKADPTITVTGQVVASPCTVDANTVTQTIDLGQDTKQHLLAAGDGGEWADFDLKVTNCPAGTSSVTAKLTGTADSQDSSAWKNSGTSGNIALRVTSRDHNAIYSVNSAVQVKVDTATRSATFPLSARMFTPTGNATAGTFLSVMSVDFTYQ